MHPLRPLVNLTKPYGVVQYDSPEAATVPYVDNITVNQVIMDDLK